MAEIMIADSVEGGDSSADWWSSFLEFNRRCLSPRSTFEQVLNQIPAFTTEPRRIAAFHSLNGSGRNQLPAEEIRLLYDELFKPADYRMDKRIIMAWTELALYKGEKMLENFNGLMVALGECPEIFAPYPFPWPDHLQLETTDASQEFDEELMQVCDEPATVQSISALSAPLFRKLTEMDSDDPVSQLAIQVGQLVWHSFVSTTIAEYWHSRDLSLPLGNRHVRLFLSIEEAVHSIGKLTPSGWRPFSPG